MYYSDFYYISAEQRHLRLTQPHLCLIFCLSSTNRKRKFDYHPTRLPTPAFPIKEPPSKTTRSIPDYLREIPDTSPHCISAFTRQTAESSTQPASLPKEIHEVVTVRQSTTNKKQDTCSTTVHYSDILDRKRKFNVGIINDA